MQRCGGRFHLWRGRMGDSFQAIIKAPFPQPPCLLGIRIEQQALIGIDYIFSACRPLPPRTPLAAEVVEQLRRYLADPRYRFDLPIHTQGTPFQLRVWAALVAIPAGERRSYGELAASLESSPRAVGNACRANQLPLIVPCHRVVSATGMGGYAGHTSGRNIAIKHWLLKHEAL